MPIQPTKLKTLFKKFRGDKEGKEGAWIETAILISNYVNTTNRVAVMKQDSIQGETSPVYINFERHGKRSMGSLLYGKLALDNYLEGLQDGPEKELCREISKILGDMYQNAKNNKEQLPQLLKNMEKWLTTYAASSPNKEEALELTKGLFTMLSCLKIGMNNIPPWFSNFSNAGQLIKAAKAELPKLMQETEKQAQILEREVEQIKADRASKEISMDEHFNDRYLKILNNESENQLTKLETLQSVATQTKLDIVSLVNKRQEKAKLEKDIEKLQALIEAAHENDSRATGRKYFQEFVTAYQDHYDTLLRVNPEQTTLLESLRKTINQESSRLISGVLYLSSWLSAPISAVGRKITPKSVSDTISHYVPDTNDSLAKRKLVEASTSALANMQEQLKAKNKEISSLESKLSDGNEALQRQIERASPEALQRIVAVSDMAVELVDEYTKARQLIEAMSNKLQEIKKLDSIANDFININDNARSKIYDWFARFGKWFSTKSLSEKIAEAQVMKKDFAAEKIRCLQEFKGLITKLDKNPDISSPIKERIKQQLQLKETADAPLTPNQEAVDYFQILNEGKKALIPEAEDTGSQVDSQQVSMRNNH